jgi:hypothetical protein
MPTNGQQAFGMVDLGDGLVGRQRWSRAGEIKAGHLADEAAPAVATNEVGAADMVAACRRCPLHVDAVFLLDESGDVTLAAHLDPKGESAIGQHGFDGSLIDWVGTPFRLLLCILSNKRQASEMANELGPFAAHVGSVLVSELLDHFEAARLCGGDGGGHPATL